MKFAANKCMNETGQNSMVPHFITVEPRTSRRRGAVSIWAIVCLLLVTAMGATLGRLALMGSRHMIQERRQSQAEWLLQSGWLLASTRLHANSDYKGETWNVPAAELGGADDGRVKIEVVAPSPGAPPGPREVSIIAEFPIESTHRIQLTRRRTWHNPRP